MKASELRIGNKLMLSKEMQQSLFDSCEISLRNNVISITKIDVDNDIEAWVNSNDDDEIIDFCLDTHIKPIPLTEEWFLKFGFDATSRGYIIGEHWVFPLLITRDKFGYIMKIFNNDIGTLCSPTLEYVHQLQNLYFALTGEELEIN